MRVLAAALLLCCAPRVSEAPEASAAVEVPVIAVAVSAADVSVGADELPTRATGSAAELAASAAHPGGLQVVAGLMHK